MRTLLVLLLVVLGNSAHAINGYEAPSNLPIVLNRSAKPVDDSIEIQDLRRSIIEDVSKRRAIDPDLITQFLIENHRLNFNAVKASEAPQMSSEDYSAWLTQLIQAAETRDHHAFKLAYESELLKKGRLKYNRKAFTIGHIATGSRLQCASGTDLFSILKRLAVSRSIYRAENNVIIHTCGHVLPGYLKKEKGVWQLHGIETTALGRAHVNYGPAGALTGNIRVITTDDYALIDAVAPYINNDDQVMQAALRNTERLYGFSFDAMNSISCPQAPPSSENTQDGQCLPSAGSLFGFGSSQSSSDEDQEMPTLNEISPREYLVMGQGYSYRPGALTTSWLSTPRPGIKETPSMEETETADTQYFCLSEKNPQFGERQFSKTSIDFYYSRATIRVSSEFFAYMMNLDRKSKKNKEFPVKWDGGVGTDSGPEIKASGVTGFVQYQFEIDKKTNIGTLTAPNFRETLSCRRVYESELQENGF